jgi:hypothetical protein
MVPLHLVLLYFNLYGLEFSSIFSSSWTICTSETLVSCTLIMELKSKLSCASGLRKDSESFLLITSMGVSSPNDNGGDWSSFLNCGENYSLVFKITILAPNLGVSRGS